MADLRFDPLTGIWVAVSRRRLDRPMELVPVREIQQPILCPFCRGNEEETPTAVLALDEQGRSIELGSDPPGWTVRIVPNKYPALNESKSEAAATPWENDSRDGIQEIVVPTPRHLTSLSELNDDEMGLALVACRERIAQLQTRPDLKHLMLFMNVGSAAGATLSHVHLQLIATPLVSPSLERRIQSDRDALRATGLPRVQQIRNAERTDGRRMIERTDQFDLFCPYASRFAFQTWLVPERATARFDQTTDEQLAELAPLIRRAVQRLERVLDHPAYNVLLHQMPVDVDEGCWYLELFPRFTVPAGFELGTDIWINPVPPEMAARRLQTAMAP